MHPEFLHIYGPISIQWYGLMIFIGILVFTYAILKDPQRSKLISNDQFFDLMALGILIGIVGGRLLFVLTNRGDINSFYEAIAIWDGGFSILGSILGIIGVLPIYLRKKGIRIFELLDFFAIYAPLLQSISRIGCFFAGCCYGCPTNLLWGVKCSGFCNLEKGHYLHPTQLYSALLLFIIYILLRYWVRNTVKKPGQLTMLYLILESVERFIVDFWRGDREFLAKTGFLGTLSIHQCIAMGICGAALIILCWIKVRAQQKDEFI